MTATAPRTTWHLAPFPAYSSDDIQAVLTEHYVTAEGAAWALHLHSLTAAKVAAERGTEVLAHRTLTPCTDAACAGCREALRQVEISRRVREAHQRRWTPAAA